MSERWTKDREWGWKRLVIRGRDLTLYMRFHQYIVTHIGIIFYISSTQQYPNYFYYTLISLYSLLAGQQCEWNTCGRIKS